MATWSDKLVGSVLILISVTLFLYYSVWVFILPFMESSHPLQNYFLPRYYSILIPVTLGVILLLIIGLFVSMVVMQQRAKQAAKQKPQ